MARDKGGCSVPRGAQAVFPQESHLSMSLSRAFFAHKLLHKMVCVHGEVEKCLLGLCCVPSLVGKRNDVEQRHSGGI